EVSNGEVSLVVTVDFGPRIIRYGFVDGKNELCENSDVTLDSQYGEWKLKGGHRLWHSPESLPRTYIADNKPVRFEIIENGVRVTQEIEPWVQIQKQLEITLEPDSNKAQIIEKLTNLNAWPVELAVWSLTVMAPGGKEIIPLSKKATGLLPNRSIVLWPYARINDERVTWLDQYVLLDIKPAKDEAFKIGTNNEDGWAAYLNEKNLFIKKYKHEDGKSYPDSGSSYETYTNGNMAEMEILSPLEKLEPGSAATLTETWELKKDVSVNKLSEENIEQFVKDYIL
ncbi:MAG: hypothetical protein Q8942_10720, partial [Bacillota bacterium]|nr:hypothetical protein [Bacillota bacterium]